MDLQSFYEGMGQNYQVVLKRMMSKEDFLLAVLKKFLEDGTMAALEQAVAEQNAREIFIQAHTLKGVTENLGLKKLYDQVFVLVELSREGSAAGTKAAFAAVKDAYIEVTDQLKNQILK